MTGNASASGLSAVPDIEDARYHVYHHKSGDSLATTIVAAIADVTGCSPAAVGEIRNVVDPDALDALFYRDGGIGGYIRFQLHGYEVTVHSDGHITLIPF